MGGGTLLLAGGPLTDILAATEDGLRIVGREEPLLDGSITAVAARGPDLWAVRDERSVWRSTAGQPWRRVGDVPDHPARCLLAAEGQALVGTARARLFRIEDGRTHPVESFDGAPGRDDWYTPWGGPPDTRSLAMGVDGTLYANVHVGGILRREGNGWRPTIDIDADVHQVLAHPSDPSVVLAACALGLATSTDAGDSWDVTDAGLHGSYARAVAVTGDTVVISASTGPFTDRAALYRRPVDGGPFERCTEGLPEWFPSNVDSHCLASADGTVVAGTGEGHVYRSDDRGRTWERAASGLAPVRAVIVRSP